MYLSHLCARPLSIKAYGLALSARCYRDAFLKAKLQEFETFPLVLCVPLILEETNKFASTQPSCPGVEMLVYVSHIPLPIATLKGSVLYFGVAIGTINETNDTRFR